MWKRSLDERWASAVLALHNGKVVLEPISDEANLADTAMFAGVEDLIKWNGVAVRVGSPFGVLSSHQESRERERDGGVERAAVARCEAKRSREGGASQPHFTGGAFFVQTELTIAGSANASTVWRTPWRELASTSK